MRRRAALGFRCGLRVTERRRFLLGRLSTDKALRVDVETLQLETSSPWLSSPLSKPDAAVPVTSNSGDGSAAEGGRGVSGAGPVVLHPGSAGAGAGTPDVLGREPPETGCFFFNGVQCMYVMDIMYALPCGASGTKLVWLAKVEANRR